MMILCYEGAALEPPLPSGNLVVGRFVISRGQEEKWAAENCRLTKILGWSMIATFCFSIIAAMMTDGINIDILMLIGGIAIKKGSQAWLRFYCFITIATVLGMSSSITIDLIRQEPFEVNRKWVSYLDSDFWYGYIGPLGLIAGLGTLCMAVLKARKLVFWTSTTKRWVVACVTVVLLITAIGFIYSLIEPSDHVDVEQAIPLELEAIRHYAKTSGATYSSATLDPLVETLKKNPAVEEVMLRSSPSSGMTIYSAKEGSHYEWDHEEFVKGSTSLWIQIQIRLKK